MGEVSEQESFARQVPGEADRGLPVSVQSRSSEPCFCVPPGPRGEGRGPVAESLQQPLPSRPLQRTQTRAPCVRPL